MPLQIKHATQAVGTDAGNGEIRKAQWNEAHAITMSSGALLGRSSAGTGDAEEVTVGPRLSVSGGTLTTGPNYTVNTTGATETSAGTFTPTVTYGKFLWVAYFIGKQTTGAGAGYAGFVLKGVGSVYAGTVSDVGNIMEEIVARSSTALSVDVRANAGVLTMYVTGETGETYSWLVNLQVFEV